MSPAAGGHLGEGPVETLDELLVRQGGHLGDHVGAGVDDDRGSCGHREERSASRPKVFTDPA